MADFTPPNWLTEKCGDEYKQSVRNATVRFLYDSDLNEILENVRSSIRSKELWHCEMTTLFAL